MAIPTKLAHAIKERYGTGEHQLIQDRLDFLLPQIRSAVETDQWVNLHPEYQRRLVWDNKKKSLFIESLLMNIPIPPVFLFEAELNRYEVMDGQQRLNSIVEFYDGAFPLIGLDSWSLLNGLRYKQFPEWLKRGLDRRKLSAIVIAAETKPATADPDLRRQVLERLNTGGLHLNAQELRNCLYSREFNELLIELSSSSEFTSAWSIPPHKYSQLPRGRPSPGLAENEMYRRMKDCEIVLRFFAFREENHIRGSVRSILDKCMERHKGTSATQLAEYRSAYITRLKLARDVFRDEVFRIQDEGGTWRVSPPLYDGVMVAIDRLWDQRVAIRNAKGQIKEKLAKTLQKPSAYALIVGRPNTAQAIRARLDLLTRVIRSCLR